MTPDDVRASRVEWIAAYLKADSSLVREVLEGLGLPNYEAARQVAWDALHEAAGDFEFVLRMNWVEVMDAAWRLPEEET